MGNAQNDGFFPFFCETRTPLTPLPPQKKKIKHKQFFLLIRLNMKITNNLITIQILSVEDKIRLY